MASPSMGVKSWWSISYHHGMLFFPIPTVNLPNSSEGQNATIPNLACSLRRSQRVLRRQSDEGWFVLRWASIKPPISCRSCGNVSAGVWIFSPPRLLIQEPRGQERQGLVMMPGDPVSHLIVRQPGFPLGPLEALLDAMCRLRDAGQFFQRRIGVRTRQVIIKLESMIRLTLPGQEQQLLGAGPLPLRPSLDPAFYRFDHQRSFLSVTHLDPGPSILRQGRAPSVHTNERRLRPWPTSAVRRRWHFDVANCCVRGDRKQIAFAQSTQLQAKTAGPAHFVVAGDPGMWQRLTIPRQHLERQLVPGLKRDGLGHSGLLPTRPVLGPLLGKIKTYINNCMFYSSNVTHVDTYLAVVDLAEPATPLLGDPHRLGPFLGKPRGVKHDDAIGFAQVLANLGCQCPEHRLMVPGNLSNELLNPLPLLIEEVRDSFTSLAFQLRHQPGDVLGRVTPVIGSGKVIDKRLDKLLQSREHTPKQIRGDMRLFQQLIKTRLESSFHDNLLRANLRYGRECHKEG